MRGPRFSTPIETCTSFELPGNSLFSQLSPTGSRDFDAVKSCFHYPSGKVLFLENQVSFGVFLLCSGEMKLSVISSTGRALTLKIARPGEVFGLTAALTGNPYEGTAMTLRPSNVIFIRQGDFLQLLVKHPEANAEVVRQLSASYLAVCAQLRTVGLAASATEKLTRVLLEWSAEGKTTIKRGRIKLPLSHEEIAQLIGTTRETVTRTLSKFKHHPPLSHEVL